jgi:hypothetical protein
VLVSCRPDLLLVYSLDGGAAEPVPPDIWPVDDGRTISEVAHELLYRIYRDEIGIRGESKQNGKAEHQNAQRTA